ncbi:hypothetical protein AQUSIP_17180 [Aquicella siphonis]|uniref:Tyrosine specific protein phosphatases domain-containing protein n=1 Tax=Aquicella siphonis TaxID=254247 RepID=A0A5E4PJD0_9COXI|nr:dual specificity protein phosphatase family protein [Aquicella siphonis]VVC76406.1 hypothetical protein AQUSIP_17180 [Aquicella siphonis]
MKSSTEVLLDEDSLKRHFNFVTPGSLKVLKFKVSNRYNEVKNKKKKSKIEKSDEIETGEILQDIKDEKVKSRNPMDVVAKGIILGVIPKSTQLDDIVKEARKNPEQAKSIHIFSITDEFEQGMPGMLQPKELELREIQEKYPDIQFKHHQVPMTDFGAEISPQAILAAVYKMRKIIEEGGTVYIHCKAGRARSAMIVAAYLAIFGDEKELTVKSDDPANPPLSQAVTHLKHKRSQVALHEDKVSDWKNLMQIKGVAKLQKAQEAVNLHHAIKNELIIGGAVNLKTDDYIKKFNECAKNNWKEMHWDRPSVKKASGIKKLIEKFKNEPSWHYRNGSTTLSTLEFKNELINMTSFKQLKIYATQFQNALKPTSKRTAYINKFFKQIYESQNDDWYDKLKKGEGPLWKLYHNSKATNEIRAAIDLFIAEIGKYRDEKEQVKTSAHQVQTPFEIIPMPSMATDALKISANPSGMFYPQISKVSELHKHILHLLNAVEKKHFVFGDDYKDYGKDKAKLEGILEKFKKDSKTRLTQGDLSAIKSDIKEIEHKVKAAGSSIKHRSL